MGDRLGDRVGYRVGDRVGDRVGYRVGYRVAPNRPDWEYRGNAVAGGPIDRARGPIVRVTVGVGGR